MSDGIMAGLRWMRRAIERRRELGLEIVERPFDETPAPLTDEQVDKLLAELATLTRKATPCVERTGDALFIAGVDDECPDCGWRAFRHRAHEGVCSQYAHNLPTFHSTGCCETCGCPPGCHRSIP